MKLNLDTEKAFANIKKKAKAVGRKTLRGIQILGYCLIFYVVFVAFGILKIPNFHNDTKQADEAGLVWEDGNGSIYSREELLEFGIKYANQIEYIQLIKNNLIDVENRLIKLEANVDTVVKDSIIRQVIKSYCLYHEGEFIEFTNKTELIYFAQEHNLHVKDREDNTQIAQGENKPENKEYSPLREVFTPQSVSNDFEYILSIFN